MTNFSGIKRIAVLAIMLFSALMIFSFKQTNSDFKLPKFLKKQFSFIPSGKVFLENDTVSVNAFYMSNFEISNIQYREFLMALKKENKSSAYNVAQMDTNNWLTEHGNGFLDPFVGFYHQHDAYNEYPAVNVSIEGARLFCKWLTETINDKIQGANHKVLVRLPYRAEWMRAANGNNPNAVYSWRGLYLRDSKGDFLCNFSSVGEENIAYDKKADTFSIKGFSNEQHLAIDQKTKNWAQVISPAKSYFPNDFGMHNMNGNVAELVEDKFACGGSWSSTGYDVRNQSKILYEKSSSKIGFRPVIVVVPA